MAALQLTTEERARTITDQLSGERPAASSLAEYVITLHDKSHRVVVDKINQVSIDGRVRF